MGARATLELTAAALVTAVCVALLPATVAGATTFTVTNCNDSGTGSLRLAVASAASGDSVNFSSSLSPCTADTVTLTSGPIEIAQNLTITGPGAGTLAVSGGGTSTVFLVDSAVTAGISGLTIEDGSNSSGSGGGVLDNGILTLTNDTVSDNSAAQGGGVYDNGTLTISDSTLSGNTGASGGGVYDNGGSVTVSDSTLSTNGASTAGGGLFVQGGTVIVSDSTLSGNAAPVGGGIDNNGTGGGTVTVSNSTLKGNGAATTGGGGGVSNGSGATLNLAATVVADSTNGDCANAGTSNDQGYNIDDDGSCGFGTTSGVSHSLTLDASLVSLAGNGGPTKTVALLPGSPAIGLVNSTSLCATPDQRGVTRPTPVCDSGAYQTFITLTPTALVPRHRRIPLQQATDGPRGDGRLHLHRRPGIAPLVGVALPWGSDLGYAHRHRRTGHLHGDGHRRQRLQRRTALQPVGGGPHHHLVAHRPARGHVGNPLHGHHHQCQRRCGALHVLGASGFVAHGPVAERHQRGGERHADGEEPDRDHVLLHRDGHRRRRLHR